MADRPVLAVVSNALTPYRLHYPRRIALELPEVELWSLFTHGRSSAPFAAGPPPEIRPVEFGPGEASEGQGRPRFALREWRKGGRVIRWLRERGAGAVVLGGYN